jgi:hypothetical protein
VTWGESWDGPKAFKPVQFRFPKPFSWLIQRHDGFFTGLLNGEQGSIATLFSRPPEKGFFE